MKVLTIGEILVEVMRPNVDVSLSERGDFKGPYPSGAPAIFIYNLASLGQKAGILSKVGDDAFGKNCVDHLMKKGVDLKGVKSSKLPTGVAFVTYYSDGSRDFLYHISNAACGQISPSDLNDDLINEYNWLHLNGSSLCINKNVRDLGIEAARRIKSKGGMVSFDPNIRRELFSEDELDYISSNLLPLCDYVMPSEGEELTITGTDNRDDSIQKLFECGVKKVFLKLGEYGSKVYTKEDTIYEPGYSINEVDPTGAGDSFCSAIVYGLINNWKDDKIVKFANGLGAIAASNFGPMEWDINEQAVWDFIDQQKKVRNTAV
jgi:sugar/nucleoside kinase (ribokinase family)